MISESDIAEAVDVLAARIVQPDLMVIVATGGIVFGADLLRAMWRMGKDCRVKVVSCSSYGDERSPVSRPVVSGLSHVESLKVLVVDDVLDTGASIAAVRAGLYALGAADVEVAVLVDKCNAPFVADYAAFCGDMGFIVGYGMDDAGYKRGMPHIEVVR